MSILDLYCSVDAFWQRFEPLWKRELLEKSGAPAAAHNTTASREDRVFRAVSTVSMVRQSRAVGGRSRYVAATAGALAYGVPARHK